MPKLAYDQYDQAENSNHPDTPTNFDFLLSRAVIAMSGLSGYCLIPTGYRVEKYLYRAMSPSDIV